MIRRMTFVFGFVFVGIFSLLRWVVTGKSATELLDRFEKWGLQ